MQTGTAPKSVNLNCFVWARLTEWGKAIYTQHYPETEVPEDGWIRMQLQGLMELFGPYRTVTNRPIDAFIYFEKSK